MDNPSRSNRLRRRLPSLSSRGSATPPLSTPHHQGLVNIPSLLSRFHPAIQDRRLQIDPQSSSPLYNGLIPPEIRDQIFILAMTEFTKTDKASQYPLDTNYTRPGYTGKRSLTTALLRTCRKVYMETYHLPPVMKEHVFWHDRGPGQDEISYFRRMKPWQTEMVREVHVFAQMFWLEDSFRSVYGVKDLQGVEKLRITIRRGDWWWNESNAPLGICPQGGSAQNGEMLIEWEREKRGENIPWKPNAWGSAFAILPNLKELEIELETSEDKISELNAIVEKAKAWKFPMKDGMVLSNEGLEVKTMKWRSSACYWSDRCPYCLRNTRDCWKQTMTATQKCKEKGLLKREGKGPMCTIVSLRWRVAKGEGQR